MKNQVKNSINSKKVAENLKVFRELLGLKQHEFAEPLGITHSYISNVERGKNKLSDSVLHLIKINYRLNEKWLFTGEGEPFVKEWLEDKNLLFEGKGGPIKEFTQDLGVWVGVKYAEDDPRNPKNKAAEDDLYNIDTINSEVHSPDVVYCPGPWQDVLKKAREILEANTEDSNALAANIEASHKSMLEKTDLKKRMEQLEKKLSTVGREKEENSLARKTGS